MNTYLDFACSEQGYNHIKVGKECQDASGSYSDDLMSIAVVADGHGSDNYPRTAFGSKFAVKAAIDAIKEFVQTIKNSEEIQFNADEKESAENMLYGLANNILGQWHNLVDEHVKFNPFSEADFKKVSDKYIAKYNSGECNAKAYGTTLLAACITEDFWFGVHIGDGKCVTVNNDFTTEEPIPWDENCQMNVTTSICDDDASSEFRVCFSKDVPLGIFLGCDGIDDSYSGDEELHALYLALLEVFAEEGFDEAIKQIKEFLPKTSQSGSGDDVSISGLVRADMGLDIKKKLKEKIEHDSIERELKKVEQEFSEAEEKVGYINNALNKAKENFEKAEKTYQDAQAKALKAQEDLERIAAKRQQLIASLQKQ